MTGLPASVDAVIWGASIAGAQAAKVLARAGHSVLVFPRGPGSYLQTPGFALANDRVTTRRFLENDLLEAAEVAGATIARGVRLRGIQPESGPVRSVVTKTTNISLRALVFADGSDPRMVRPRGLVPDWDPWHLVHFAYQMFPAVHGRSGVQVIAGERDGRAWRGYAAAVPEGLMLAVGWFLEHEMATHVHAAELLPAVREQFGITSEPMGETEVEIVPFGGNRVEAVLASGNMLVTGDMAGVMNPFAIHRAERALEFGKATADIISRALEGNGPVHFGSKTAKFLRSSLQKQEATGGEPPFPEFPLPVHRRQKRIPALFRHWKPR